MSFNTINRPAGQISEKKPTEEEIMPSLVKAPFFLECLARGKQLFVSQY